MPFVHHSAAVHIPLALAVLFPFFHIGLMLAQRLKNWPTQAWILHWALVAVQVLCNFLSFATGQRDVIMSSAATELLQAHRELGLQFNWIWIAVLLLYPLAFVLKNKPVSKLVHLLLLILFAGQFYIAVRLGQIGGQIVFGS